MRRIDASPMLPRTSTCCVDIREIGIQPFAAAHTNRAHIACDLWHCPWTLRARSVAPMAAILTMTCELALLGLVWLLWREAERADQEVEMRDPGRQ